MGHKFRKHLFMLGFCIIGTVAQALPAVAEDLTPACIGNNLFGEMSADRLATLRAASDAVPYSQGLLWRASKAGSEIVLAGTYHLHDPRHQDILAQLEPELDRAGILLVEATPEDEDRLGAALQSDQDLLFDLQGPPLTETLAPEVWNTVATEVERRGVPAPLAERMRPWYLSMILGFAPCTLEVMAARGGPDGLDHLLMQKAEEAALPIEGLEPWDTLFTLFGDLSPVEGMLMLQSALATAAQGNDIAVTTADAYFEGRGWDIWMLSEEMTRNDSNLSPQEAEEQIATTKAMMMDGRNRSWLDPIEAASNAAAANGKTAIVAVGLLHLPGEDGLLNLLAMRGWTITRLH